LRSGSSFAASWATALLARSFASCLRNSSGLAASKRRILSLESSFAVRVLMTTETFLSSRGTVVDLVEASLRAYDHCPPEFRAADENWESIVGLLETTKK
jgi:hypothetical protein